MISVNRMVIGDQIIYNGETLLTYRIEYPKFRSICFPMCLLKVNKFYKDQALAFQKYCETELFSMAVKQYHESMENNVPIRTFDAQIVYKVKYMCPCIISIYFDRYEYTGGAHGITIRESQTWNVRKCEFIKLSQLVSCLPYDKAYILSAVESQINQNPEIYFENYKERIVDTFNENSFYCRPEGIVIYYQQYDIAPYSSGIREFLLPYSDCIIKPKKLC